MQNEIAELRHNLAELIFEIDQNIFHESKYLERIYRKIGRGIKVVWTNVLSCASEKIGNSQRTHLEIIIVILTWNLSKKFWTSILKNIIPCCKNGSTCWSLLSGRQNCSHFQTLKKISFVQSIKNLLILFIPSWIFSKAEAATELYNEGVTAFSKRSDSFAKCSGKIVLLEKSCTCYNRLRLTFANKQL